MTRVFKAINNNCKISRQMSVNQHVKQRCSIAPTFSNIYIEVLVKKGKQPVNTCFMISQDRYLNVLLSTDDSLVIQT